MAKGALFVGWGVIIPGREEAAPQVLNEAVQWLVRLQQEGRIDGFEAVTLEPHGGDLAGFVLVEGNRESLASLRGEDEFLRTMVRVQLVHSKVGVGSAYTGAEMQSLFALWDREEATLI